MKRSAWWIGGLGLVVVAAFGARRAGGHSGVAPWDVPDSVNPHPGAPPGSPKVGDPPRLIRADGTSGTTDNGYTVRLVNVGRQAMNSPDPVLPDAQPAWNPDGSPFEGRYLTNWISGSAGSMENKGARYLSFELSGPRTGQIDVMGYVSDGAREDTPQPEMHGWDHGRWVYAGSRPATYQACVVVDDRAASHYRFAVAEGEWTTVAKAPLPPYERKNAVLLRGAWGTVRRHVGPRSSPFATSKGSGVDGYGTYVVSSDTLAPSDELRVSIVDEAGRPVSAFPLRSGGPRWMVVESRPWHWVELSDIHYNPDPSKWPKGGYWGAEGEKAVAHSDGVDLEGIYRTVPGEFPGLWKPREVYAPDGRRWRNLPDAARLLPTFSDPSLPQGFLVAALRFDESRVSMELPVRVAGFAAEGPVPGKGRLEPLAPVHPWPYVGINAPFPFTRPATPYVQFAVRYASDCWKKVGRIEVPHIVFPLVKPEDRAGYDDGSHSFTMFSVTLNGSGEAGLYWHTRSANIDAPGYGRKEAVVTWPKDDEGRLVAVLKSGSRVRLPHNSSGGGGVSVDFNQASDSDPVYDTTRNDPRNGVRLKLGEIAAFEVETRSYSDPVYVAAKLPPN